MNIPSSDIVTACWAIGAFIFGRGDRTWAIKRGEKRGYADAMAEVEAKKNIPTCNGCGHPYSYHKGMSLPCAFVDHRTATRTVIAKDGKGETIYDSWDNPVKTKEIYHVGDFPCDCQAYEGPEPLPSVIAY